MRAKLMLVAVLAATPALADNYVNGYLRKDGTYVQGHWRSSPDGQKWNNYSSDGNVNPYTGKAGTADPYAPPQSGGTSINNLSNRRLN